MDHAACHVVYVDKRARENRYMKRPGPSSTSPEASNSYSASPSLHEIFGELEEVRLNIGAILSIFNGVYICTSGTSCTAKLSELNESTTVDFKPVLVILDTVLDFDVKGRPTRTSRELSTPSPTFQRPELSSPLEPEDIYSLALLQYISTEVSRSELSKLIVPIAMIHFQDLDSASHYQSPSSRPHRPSDSFSRLGESTVSSQWETPDPSVPVEPNRMLKCLDAGAIDVLTSPLQKDRVYGLTAHAYRAHKEASKDQAAFLATKRLRKRSWVGLDDGKPYAYLRESMVSGLMTGICNPEAVPQAFDHRALHLLDQQESAVRVAVGTWKFSAHDFTDDQLVHAAFLMLQHALNLPELEKFRLSADDLKNFLMASRAAYNEFVLYHNFRHVVDVMQAVFYFLLQLGTLPPYPAVSTRREINAPSPIADLLKPFHALTLLISAIGHDVGHPGVNNAFIVALNAPLAQLYNDKSVLEAFHCAAYSQILRRYWKHAFDNIALRALLINSILATDMGLHFKYMSDLGNLQDRYHHNNGTEGWSPQLLDQYRTLTCGLLMKCADISNVARPFDVAAKWTEILQLEFAKQGEMEKDVGIPTALFGGPPELGNVVKLANSQIGFMNIFARPLFEAMTDIAPAMVFAVDEIKANLDVWKGTIEQEKAKDRSKPKLAKEMSEGWMSPRSGSPNRLANRSDLSHPEGLPASASSPLAPTRLSMSAQHLGVGLESRRSSQGSFSASNETLQLGSQSQSENQSRRSSLGLPLGYSGHSPDSVSNSRRSSGAFPTANTPIQVLTTKPSSNTVPSQLQSGVRAAASTAPTTPENSNPARRTSVDMLSQSPANAAEVSGVSPRRGDSYGGRSGGDIIRRGDSLRDTNTSPTRYNQAHHNRHPNSNSIHPTSGHSSAFSSQNGDPQAAFGARASIRPFKPYSPAETQTTNFLTTHSDDKSFHDAEDWTSTSKSMPGVVDVERLGSGSRLGDDIGETENSVETSVINGNGGFMGRDGSGDLTASRKSLRFRFDFWKKKGKAMDASP